MVVSFYYGILHAAFILCLYLIFIWGIEDLLVDVFYQVRACWATKDILPSTSGGDTCRLLERAARL